MNSAIVGLFRFISKIFNYRFEAILIIDDRRWLRCTFQGRLLLSTLEKRPVMRRPVSDRYVSFCGPMFVPATALSQPDFKVKQAHVLGQTFI